MKQTAVEFLMEKLFDPSTMVQEQIQWFEQAKSMEKKQILQSLNDGKAMALGNLENKSLEQYYKETYEQ